MVRRVLAATLVLASAYAHADNEAPALAQIRDDKQLAQALATITSDPAIKVDDEKARPLAAALMSEGVKQLQAHAYDQALANFLEAYAKFPSPKILLNIASTLRDMGRPSDAANTYQRYLADPATGPERVAEVKQILVDLDATLTLLTVRVTPHGSEVSIDGGPFVAVGSALVARVRPGIHLVRVRNHMATGELTVNGFEGESKDVSISAVVGVSQGTTTTTPPPPEPPPTTPPTAPPEQVNVWLTDSTRYGTTDASSNQRVTRTTFAGEEVKPYIPPTAIDDQGDFVVPVAAPERRISSGASGLLRIDGKGRGVAGAVGFVLAPSDAIELEIDGMKSSIWGAYAGIRMHFLTGLLRPYVGGGVPVFFFEDEATMQNAVVFGVRAAGGVELRINGHISLNADAGVEHFFNVEGKLLDGKRPEATVFVPTVGVIGRL